MSWLGRRREKRASEAAEHPAPVEIDLGVHRAFDVQLAVERMKDEGLDVYLYTQEETVLVAGLAPQRCHVLVNAAEEQRVRAQLEADGLLPSGQ